jgi:hypothetical protein
VEFKPKLEKLLQAICLLAEVAELGQAVEELEEDDPLLQSLSPHLQNRKTAVSRKETVRRVGSVRFENVPSGDSDDEESSTRSTKELPRTMSGTLKIKSFLDRWEEPVNKLQKTEASIKDVLRFRHALELMDESHPFGEAFGEASTRDECIMSAHNLYWRVLKLTPHQRVLGYDTLAMIVQETESNDEEGKKKALKKLFRPDRLMKIPLLDFVQSCDNLYRRLRFFRASVDNASVIDRALEDIVDIGFFFVLFLLILSILNVNP